MNPFAIVAPAFAPIVKTVADNVRLRVDAAALQTQARRARAKIADIDARVASVAPKPFPWVPILIGAGVLLFVLNRGRSSR